MAANMMEILKRIQSELADQKNYMRNLHVINKNLNEKLNFMEERVRDLPQVLVTIGRLEQQVKKNNMLLFGNDETDHHFEDRTLVPYNAAPDDNNAYHLVEPSEKCMDNTKDTQLPNSCKLSHTEETKLNKKETKQEYNSQRTHKYKDEVGELITTEIREIKYMIKDFIEMKHTSVEEGATCSRHVAAGMSPTNLDIDQQQSKLDDKLNNMTKVYENDMRAIKELIKDSIKINKKSIEETSKTLLKQETASISFSSEQISQLSDGLKRITDMTQSETRDIKQLIKDSTTISKKSFEETSKTNSCSAELISQLSDAFKRITDITQTNTREMRDLIKDSVAASKMSIHEATELRKQETVQSAMTEIKEFIKDLVKKTPVDGAASTVREQRIVKISPTYFSPDQLSKVNSELKLIADTYQETNIFPIVEVGSEAVEEHKVMQHLRKGVYYKDIRTGWRYYKVKLGVDGFKRSDVIDLITEYPNLTVNDVVREWMMASKVWDVWRKEYQFQPYSLYSNGEYYAIH